MERNYSVYLHTAPNGKVYVGITGRDPEMRWRNGTGYSSCPHFQSAIKKYGWANIKHEVLFTGLTREEACEAEKTFIQLFDSTNREKGYNNTFGGDKGLVMTEETRKKISQKASISHSTLEYREKASKWMRERKVSEETRAKLSVAGKGRPNPCSEEKRRKMSEVARKRLEDPEKARMARERGKEISRYGYEKARRVNQYSLDGTFIKTFESMKEAGRETGVRDGNISMCCNGKRHKTGGYIWRFAD